MWKMFFVVRTTAVQPVCKATCIKQSSIFKGQGPAVQSVISLTSLLRVISLTVFVDSIYNILIFFAEKM